MKRKGTTLKYLRSALRAVNWTKKDKTCCISGRKDDLEMHHSGKSFTQLFDESLKACNLEYHKFYYDYTGDELKILKKDFIDRHFKECEAVTLNADIHKELHDKYGRDVTKEQLEEFKQEHINNNLAAIKKAC